MLCILSDVSKITKVVLFSATPNPRLMVCRCCKGVRVAAYRGLHKLWSFLPLGDTYCSIFSLLGSSERCWPLDWNTSRCRTANSSAGSFHGLHKLGKPGPFLCSLSFFFMTCIYCEINILMFNWMHI